MRQCYLNTDVERLLPGVSQHQKFCYFLRMTTIYQHTDCLAHNPGSRHAESPGRFSVIMNALRASTLQLQYAAAPLGTDAQILLAHTRQHLDLVKASAPAEGLKALDPDTVMSPGTLNAALRGVGGACLGVDDLVAGNERHAFVLTRPPGHHATPNRAMGFCVFNHIAIAALHAQAQHHLQRIAVVDFDVHHGNGTQDIAAGREGLLYISTHQSPLYPGTGSAKENRACNILNVPLRGGTGDATYREIFSEEVLPALNAFKPQLVLVSAGFDAHEADPLAGLAFTEATYGWLGWQLRKVVDTHAGGKLLSVLEGGYNLDVLGASVVAYLAGAA
jgi:acetoin utilization deacetylase AcuC-like enzyme